MYYSNLQVNYMVTVFIKLVIAVAYTLHLLSCSKCFICLCLFQYRHCFLVGWCTNKSYVIATSDLWLFIHASNLLPLNTPHHSPTFLKDIILFLSYVLWVWYAKLYCAWHRRIVNILLFIFERDGVVDLSEVRDAIVKSTGSNEMGHPCIRSKNIFFSFFFLLTSKQILSGTKKKETKKQ